MLPVAKGGRKPVVGLVLSVWTSVKKPKLAVMQTSLSHVVAARIVVMEGHPDRKTFSCSALSEAWVIKPESIVGILAFENMADEPDGCTIGLNTESFTMLKELEPLASSSVHF